MRELDAAAEAAFGANHPIEALRHLVGLLAVDDAAPAEADGGRLAARGELARKADATLTAVGGRLTLEPTDAWLSDGVQVSGVVRDVIRGRGRAPSVRLVINYDSGKAVVADAPIRFAFVAGAGDVTEMATTDAYGVASATVRSIANADRPAVIRAALVVENRGVSRKFGDTFLDFTYLPSSRTARILAVERRAGTAPSRADTASALVDAVSRGLEATGLEILPIGGAPDDSGPAEGGWLVQAVTEYEDASQMVNRGRGFDIYTATARTRIRILDSGGVQVVSRPELTSVGRGGTADAAVRAALAASRAAAEKDLRGAAAVIGSALD